jgi:hypothetical protein
MSLQTHRAPVKYRWSTSRVSRKIAVFWPIYTRISPGTVVPSRVGFVLGEGGSPRHSHGGWKSSVVGQIFCFSRL